MNAEPISTPDAVDRPAAGAVNRPPPFQFSLRTLLLVMTIAAVLLAAASGAFGQVAQFVILSLLIALAAVIAEILLGVLLLVLVIVTLWLPLWLVNRLYRFACRGLAALVLPINRDSSPAHEAVSLD